MPLHPEKISLYLPSLRGGGAERVMTYLANGFAERGHPTTIVAADAIGPNLELVSPKVDVVDLKAKRVRNSAIPLLRYLKSAKPHALLSTPIHTNIIAGMVKHFHPHVRLVLREAITLGPHSENLGRVSKLMAKHAYKQADAIVAVSKGVAAGLEETLGERVARAVTVIPNPVHLEQIAALANEEPAIPLPKNKKILLGVGRLTIQKDFPNLIRALEQVRKEINAHLVILGDGELRAELEQLIEQLGLQAHVTLAGFINNPYAFMKRADVFVLSSLWEGMPNVLLQAMACGTKVVATKCPSGPDEILENGKWGALVPLSQPLAMSEAIVKTLNDATPSNTHIRARDFDAERIIDRYLSVLLGKG